MRKSRAQGTIEYLVILAVIVVISLVVVSLMSSSAAPAGQVSDVSSKLYWQSQPISISEATADAEGDAIITLSADNLEGKSATVKKLVIDGEDVDIEDVYLTPGGSGTIFLEGLVECPDGSTRNISVEIPYESTDYYGNTLEKRIPGTTELSIVCSSGDVSEDDILTEDYVVLADTNAPAVSLLSPEDSYSDDDGSVTFTYNVHDGKGVAACYLIIDGDVNDVEYDTFGSFTQTFPFGSYTWNIVCTDTSDNNGSGVQRDFEYTDSEPPVVSLVAPEDNGEFDHMLNGDYVVSDGIRDYAVNGSSELEFEYTVTDNGTVTECILDYNGNILGTDNTPPFGSFSVDFMDLSPSLLTPYDWNVTCTDSAGNTSSSAERMLYIGEDFNYQNMDNNYVFDFFRSFTMGSPRFCSAGLEALCSDFCWNGICAPILGGQTGICSAGTCGNGSCEAAESECGCPEDCGECGWGCTTDFDEHPLIGLTDPSEQAGEAYVLYDFMMVDKTSVKLLNDNCVGPVELKGTLYEAPGGMPTVEMGSFSDVFVLDPGVPTWATFDGPDYVQPPGEYVQSVQITNAGPPGCTIWVMATNACEFPENGAVYYNGAFWTAPDPFEDVLFKIVPAT